MSELPPSPPPVARILETSLYVRDLDVAHTFYGRIFGFPLLLRDERVVEEERDGVVSFRAV